MRDINEILKFTESDLKKLNWPERRNLAMRICEHLKLDKKNEDCLRLTELLAGDEKWEVRKDIADNLLYFPEDRFLKLVSMLQEDTNSFVAKAVQRAIARLESKKRTNGKQEQNLKNIEGMRLRIEKLHGPGAADKAFRMAERLYDIMNGAAVHDMRGILTPLKSATEAMQSYLNEGWNDYEGIRRTVNKMSRSVTLMERMLDDMSEYSRQTPKNRKRERLLEVIMEAQVLALDFFKSKKMDISSIRLKMNVPREITLDIARYQIIEVFYNLIKNAYESFAISPAAFRPGEINVTAELENDTYVKIVISDNGMGLNEDELCHVRRFVPGGTSKKMTGTGFGLPIARRKISDHGGMLELNSMEASGTQATVKLPLKNEENDHDQACSYC